MKRRIIYKRGENKRSSENNLKIPKCSPNMTNLGTPIGGLPKLDIATISIDCIIVILN
jgi:hypothetical protein